MLEIPVMSDLIKSDEEINPSKEVSQRLVDKVGLEKKEEEYEEYDPNVRKKIKLDPKFTAKEIEEKYHVSRTAAYKMKKQGWLFMNEKKKEVKIDNEWAEKNYKKIIEYSRIASFNVLKGFGLREEDLSL